MRPKEMLSMMTVAALVGVVAPPLRAQERTFVVPRTELAPGEWPGALSRDNLAKPRQKAPFDLTKLDVQSGDEPGPRDFTISAVTKAQARRPGELRRGAGSDKSG